MTKDIELEPIDRDLEKREERIWWWIMASVITIFPYWFTQTGTLWNWLSLISMVSMLATTIVVALGEIEQRGHEITDLRKNPDTEVRLVLAEVLEDG